jgi:DNA polymerase-3 subunit delta'
MWRISGHMNSVRLLDQARVAGRLASGYLLCGPAQIGKRAVALELAKALNCLSSSPPCGLCDQCRRIDAGSHPDVRILEVSEIDNRRMISIDVVRDVSRQVLIRPFQGQWRVTVIDGAESLSDEAANALLKILEEPPPQVLFILLTTNSMRVLDTIRSRCQNLFLRPLSNESVYKILVGQWGVDDEEAKKLSLLSQGRMGWAIRCVNDKSVLDRQLRRINELLSISRAPLEERFAHAGELAGLFLKDPFSIWEVLDLWIFLWRDVLIAKVGPPELTGGSYGMDHVEEWASQYTIEDLIRVIRSLMGVKNLLEANVNPRLALEGLALSIPQV